MSTPRASVSVLPAIVITSILEPERPYGGNTMGAKLTVFCLFLIGTVSANAQYPRDELVKKGAVRLTSAELKQFISGVVVEGPSQNNPSVIFTTKFNSDGSYESSFTTAKGAPAANAGSWTIREDGALCTEGRATGRGRGAIGRCSHWYKLDNQYYVADADDSNVAAQPRSIKK